MEVSLVDAEGLPKNCILSIRAGTTRRQAPADVLDKFTLKFPKSLQPSDPFKVDILQRLGESAVVEPITSIGKGVDRYTVNFKLECGEQGRVVLQVKDNSSPTPTESAGTEPHPFERVVPIPDLSRPSSTGTGLSVASRSAASGSSASRRHRGALQAKQYLDEHNLLSWAQLLFQDLMRERPEDPWAFINEQATGARVQSSADEVRSLSMPERDASLIKIEKDMVDLAQKLDSQLQCLQTSTISAASSPSHIACEDTPTDHRRHVTLITEEMNSLKQNLNEKIEQLASGQTSVNASLGGGSTRVGSSQGQRQRSDASFASLMKDVDRPISETDWYMNLCMKLLKAQGLEDPATLQTIPEDVVELRFCAPFHKIDHTQFTCDLLDELKGMGTTMPTLQKLRVRLREGSVIAEIRGPTAAVNEVRVLPLTTLKVMGYEAEVLPRRDASEPALAGSSSDAPPPPPPPSGKEALPVNTKLGDQSELKALAEAPMPEADSCSGQAQEESEESEEDSEDDRSDDSVHEELSLGALCKQALATFRRAGEQGTLPETWSKAIQEAVPKALLFEPSLDDLRSTTKAIFTESLEDGVLLETLVKAAPRPSIRDVCTKGLRVLVQASMDGRLIAALKDTAPSQPPLQALCRKASEKLFATAASGTLLQRLEALSTSRPRAEQDLKSLSEQAIKVLSRASASGKLADALQKHIPERQDPRKAILEPMSAHAFDGQLAAALAQVEQQHCDNEEVSDTAMTSSTPSAPPSAQACNSGKPDDFLVGEPQEEDHRKAILEPLSKHAFDGQLAAVLAQAEQQHAESVHCTDEVVSNTAMSAATPRGLPAAQSTTRDILVPACNNGKQDMVLASKPQEKDPRKAILEPLSSHAFDGQLAAALAQAEQQHSGSAHCADEVVRDTATASSTAGSLSARATTRDLLVQASDNGKLDLVLASEPQEENVADTNKLEQDALLEASSAVPSSARGKVVQEHSSEKPKTASASESQEQQLSRVRKCVRDALRKSIQDGSLSENLQAARGATLANNNEEITQVRQQVRGALANSSLDGSLAAALEAAMGPRRDSMVAPDDVAAMRRQAKVALLQAARDGSLTAAFQSQHSALIEAIPQEEAISQEELSPHEEATAREEAVPQEEEERSAENAAHMEPAPLESESVRVLREQLRDTLVVATTSGVLAAAFARTSSSEFQEILMLKQLARTHFKQSSADGRLSSALEQASGQPDPARTKDSLTSAPSSARTAIGAVNSPTQPLTLASFRAKARRAFEESADKGGLSDALRAVSKQLRGEDMETLCLRARESFTQATLDGTLFAALQ